MTDRAGGSDWRSRKRDETRERIYSVAMRLFEEHGFERVNVGQIAAAAGVSVPTFYSYFANKDQVVIVPISPRAIHRLVDSQPDGLPADRVRGAVRAFFAGYGGEERDALLARWRIIARTPSLRRRSTEYERTHAALIAAALAADEGADHTPAAVEVVAAATLAAATWAILAWAEADGHEPLGALLDQAFEALRQA